MSCRGSISPQVAAVVVESSGSLTRNAGVHHISTATDHGDLFFDDFAELVGVKGALRSVEVFFPGLMAYLIMILLSPAYNSFAFDGKGIQTYFMTPVRFRDVVLGKNLTLAGLVILELSISVGVLSLRRVGWPSRGRHLSRAVTAVTFAVVGQLSIANWSSLCSRRKWKLGK